jgi:hypothetical protein
MNITKDFDEVWFTVTPKGMKLMEGEGVGSPFHFRLEIDAADRDDWHVENVWIVERQHIGSNRFQDILVPLEGEFAKEVIKFFEQSDHFCDEIQEKVNDVIDPPVSELYRGYQEAGRTM